MDKGHIAQVLEEMAELMELKDENPFKVRAFYNGARVIDGTEQDLEKLSKEKKLKNIKGIGDHLAHVITELFEKGKCKEHEELKKSFPEGVLKMLTLQGMGPKKVKILCKKLHIKTIDELKKACENHVLHKLKGFGEKTEQNILKSIERLHTHQERHLYPDALGEAQKLIDYLSGKAKRVSIAGSLRRKKETIGDIDLLASSNEPEKLMKLFSAYPFRDQTIAQGETKSTISLRMGMNVDLRVVTDQEYPFALHYFTGSKEHNTHLRSIAKAKNLKLNEYGLFKGQKSLPCKTEEDIFNVLGLSYIEPEMREDFGEIEAAKKNDLPKDLVELKDLKGIFHNHTTQSDGVASLEDMVKKTQALGLEYIGISDHSQSAGYAHGLKPDRVKQQHKEIDALNKKLKNLTVLKGTEVDILPDGSLDFSDSILERFDFVIASIHSKFNMNEKDMTQRILKALKNKYVTMIGHPTGRLYLSRNAYPVNLYQLVDAAKDYGKAVELNSNPRRLDIDWHICKYAKSKGVPVSINPDAHSTKGIEDIKYGVGIARKGWLEKKDVLTTRPLKEVLSFLASYK